ncbi:hypothetical protein AAW14_29770 [Streptomyces hygroscopicus]|nr:hypothetical protein [Streptomyces hygroscopicus]
MLPGQAAGAAVAQNSGPAFGFRSDAGGNAFQTLSEPSLEEGFLVIQEDSHLLKDRDDVANPQVEGTERGEYLAVAEDVALGVSGEHDGQAAVDSEADAASQPRASASWWARCFAQASQGLARSAAARSSRP